MTDGKNSPSHHFTTSPLDWLLFSSAWLALAAAAQTAATLRQLPGGGGNGLSGLSHPAAWPTVALVGAATLLVYNLDAVLPYKFGQAAGGSGRKRWQQRHRRALGALAGAAAVAVAVLLWVGGWLPQLPRLLPLAALALGYSLPVWPLGPGRGRRALREIPLLKGFIIAGVWTAVTAGLPTLALGLPLAAARGLLAQRFCLVAALTIVFDIRDLSRDRAAGLRTLPAVLGVAGAKAVALALLATEVGCGLARGAAPGAVLGPAALAAVVVGLARETRGDYFFALLTDGVLLVQAGAYFLGARG